MIRRAVHFSDVLNYPMTKLLNCKWSSALV
jgi:hypothetical protein